MKAFADLGDLSEDERISVIVQSVASGNVAAFIVEDDAKADRYLKKMLPRVRLVSRGPGPVKNTVMVRVGPRES